MKKSFLPTSDLSLEPYSSILGFPRFTKREINSRIKELESLGVTKVAFWGTTKIGNLDILGKGYVGVVILAKLGKKMVAVKIRRTDSQRDSLKNEAKLLEQVNHLKVGPKCHAVSKNFLIMEYLNGQRIGDWIFDVKGKGSVREIKKVLKKILEDCYKLDEAGIDHGELSMISKHIIVGTKTTMIDFESSSNERRVSNITSATQGLFIGSGIGKKVSQFYKVPQKQKIIESLRAYKQERSLKSFEAIIKVLKL